MYYNCLAKTVVAGSTSLIPLSCYSESCQFVVSFNSIPTLCFLISCNNCGMQIPCWFPILLLTTYALNTAGLLLRWCRLPRRPSNESLWIPRLHVNRPRTGKLAYQPFARRDARDDATRGDTLENVFAIPGNEVAIVDDVAFAFNELFKMDCVNITTLVVGVLTVIGACLRLSG